MLTIIYRTLRSILSSCPEVHSFKTGKRRSKHGIKPLIFAGPRGSQRKHPGFLPKFWPTVALPMVESCGGSSCYNTMCGGVHSPRRGVSSFSPIHFLDPAYPLVALVESCRPLAHRFGNPSKLTKPNTVHDGAHDKEVAVSRSRDAT